MPGEVSRMIGSFDELSAKFAFRTAYIRGHHDCIEGEHHGTGFVPLGLARAATT